MDKLNDQAMVSPDAAENQLSAHWAKEALPLGKYVQKFSALNDLEPYMELAADDADNYQHLKKYLQAHKLTAVKWLLTNAFRAVTVPIWKAMREAIVITVVLFALAFSLQVLQVKVTGLNINSFLTLLISVWVFFLVAETALLRFSSGSTPLIHGAFVAKYGVAFAPLWIANVIPDHGQTQITYYDLNPRQQQWLKRLPDAIAVSAGVTQKEMQREWLSLPYSIRLGLLPISLADAQQHPQLLKLKQQIFDYYHVSEDDF